MQTVFVDATHWIALLSGRDNNHDRAKSDSAKLETIRLVTTELILIEILDFFCGKGDHLRMCSSKMVDALRSHHNIEVLELSATNFDAAYAEFKKHQDKGWSLTDCASFVAMREKGITTACAYDGHFTQASFTAV